MDTQLVDKFTAVYGTQSLTEENHDKTEYRNGSPCVERVFNYICWNMTLQILKVDNHKKFKKTQSTLCIEFFQQHIVEFIVEFVSEENKERSEDIRERHMRKQCSLTLDKVLFI